MKKLVLLFALVLLCAAPSFAQKPIADTIPQLKEWWRAPETEKGLGKYGVCYIPNFYHGRDAIGVSINNGQMETWLNRFPGDRENVFTWKGGGPVLQGDFNGDGLTDFMAGGYVYRGVKNGEPPDSVPVRYQNFFTDQVIDVNHDGFDDIISITGDGLFTIVQIFYGASDFNNMKFVNIDRTPLIDSLTRGERVYMGADGDMRFIMLTYKKVLPMEKPRDGYILYRAKWNKGDTLPTFEKLSSVLRYENNELPFQPGGAVFTSKHIQSKYFITRESLANSTFLYNIVIYDVTNDKFNEKLRYRADNTYTITPLSQSIDNDEIEDLVIRQYGGTSTILKFFSGKNLPDSIPFATYQSGCDNPPITVCSIGDVSGDDIADLAIDTYPSQYPNCFIIIKGFSESTNVVELNSTQTNTGIETLPHPVNISLPSTVRVTVTTPQLYFLDLATLTGVKIIQQELGFLESGTHSIGLNPELLKNKSKQSLVLRLLDNKKNIVNQRIIIIE